MVQLMWQAVLEIQLRLITLDWAVQVNIKLVLQQTLLTQVQYKHLLLLLREPTLFKCGGRKAEMIQAILLPTKVDAVVMQLVP